MASEEVIIFEAQTYVNSNKTIQEIASDLHISKRTLQLHIKKLETINKKLYVQVKEKQKSNETIGRVKGGQNGKRSTTISKEKAEELANYLLRHETTYQDASSRFDIPKSTIYEATHSDNISSELRSMLDTLAEAHNHDLTVADYKNKMEKK